MRRRTLVLAIVVAALIPVAVIGTCAATLMRVQGEVVEHATRTMTACSPRGTDAACHEALGSGVAPQVVASVQALLAAEEEQRGEFLSMSAYDTCTFTGVEGSARELRANVEWSAGTEAVAFRWHEVDGDWQIATLAAAQSVPRLCR